MAFKFEKLEVWQKSIELTFHIHELTREFPREELYILTSQIKRAADSVAFNPDFAVDVVARRRKPQRNVQLERFCNEGISRDMLRNKIVKQALQQGFSSRSR